MEFDDSAKPDLRAGSSDADTRLLEVLVIDYVAETRRAACEALSDEGLNVWSAGSLEASLDQLKRRQPDAVVIGIDAPGLDGHALCEVIHRTYPARSFAILVVKRSVDEHDLAWIETIPDLQAIEGPVTARKIVDSLVGKSAG